MLDTRTKQTIDNACDVLVGKVPNPQTQVDIITTALIYKFMDDMDLDGLELSGHRTFFVDDLEPYAFSAIVNTKGNQDRMNLYLAGLDKVQVAKSVPELFRRIFKEAMIPFRDPTTFSLFLKEINELSYDDSETIGDAFEYLLNKMATAKNAGQFRTPRNIIDFIVDVVNPTKDDTILDPACGTAGFLISAYKHITSDGKLTPAELKQLTGGIVGMDIDPTMAKLALVNLYLHQFEQPKVHEYDTLSDDTRWGEKFDVILANPPFMTPKGGITPHNRFAIRANRSEVLFVDYFMEHLNVNGRAGFVVPEGIIFQTANAYKDLRKMMLDGYLYAVVSLPAGVFNPYSGVKTSILFFDRAFAKQNKDILFVRVDNDGFSLGAQRTPIKQNDLPEALKIINEYRDGKDVSGYERAMIASKERIAENNYDLTAAKYIEKETRECKYEMVKLGGLIEENPKSSIQVNEVKNNLSGKMPFFTSGTNVYRSDTALVSGKNIFLATGGNANIKYFDGDASYSTDTWSIKSVDETTVLTQYLFVVLMSQTKYINDNLFSGAGLKHLQKPAIKEMLIPLPPLDIQQQIIDEIENKQNIIVHAREVIENLEKERCYFANLLDGIDCQDVRLGDVADFIRGPFGGSLKKEIFKEIGYLVYEQYHAINNDFDFGRYYIDENKFQEMKRFSVQEGDLIISCSGTMGKIAIIPSNYRPGIINQALLKLTTHKELNNMFLKLLLQSPAYQKQYFTNQSGVAIQNVMSVKELKDMRIPLPSIDDQRRIVAKLEAEQEIIDANKHLIDLMHEKIEKVIARIYKCDVGVE